MADDKISNVSNLLWKVACCFRDRIVQLRTKHHRSRDSEDNSEDVVSTTMRLSEIFLKSVDDENAPLLKLFSKPEYIIEPRAYQVPCPRSSGAVFNGLGTLLCFGGAELNILSVNGESKRKRINSEKEAEETTDKINFDSSLRSYADLLLKLKEGLGVDESDGGEPEIANECEEEEDEEEEEEEQEDYLKAITSESRTAKDSLTALAEKLDNKENKKALAAKREKADESKEYIDIANSIVRDNLNVDKASVEKRKNFEDDVLTKNAPVSLEARNESNFFSGNMTSALPTH